MIIITRSIEIVRVVMIMKAVGIGTMAKSSILLVLARL